MRSVKSREETTKNRQIGELAINIAVSGLSFLFAFLVGGAVIALFGSNPVEVYLTLFKGAFGTAAAATISLTKSVPMILTGLAVALAFKCTVFNIGAEGQLLIGAMAAALVGHYVNLPAALHISATLLSAMAAGMIWAFVPALLKQKVKIHVVISTIMFNYIAQYLVQYLILGPFRGDGSAAATHAIQNTAKLPKLIPAPYVMNIGLIIALVMVVLVYFLLNRTSMGYEMRAVGLNANASMLYGINVERNMFFALLFSGALAGLAGGIEVTGSLNKIVNNFSPGYGFNGISVALMARNNPFAIILTALLIGSMRNGSLLVQSSLGISKNIIDIMQGLIIVFLCAENILRYYIRELNNRVGRRKHG